MVTYSHAARRKGQHLAHRDPPRAADVILRGDLVGLVPDAAARQIHRAQAGRTARVHEEVIHERLVVALHAPAVPVSHLGPPPGTAHPIVESLLLIEEIPIMHKVLHQPSESLWLGLQVHLRVCEGHACMVWRHDGRDASHVAACAENEDSAANAPKHTEAGRHVSTHSTTEHSCAQERERKGGLLYGPESHSCEGLAIVLHAYLGIWVGAIVDHVQHRQKVSVVGLAADAQEAEGVHVNLHVE